jgi:hypothetical protein
VLHSSALIKQELILTLLMIQLLGTTLIALLTVFMLTVITLLSALFALSKVITWPVMTLLEKRAKHATKGQ